MFNLFKRKLILILEVNLKNMSATATRVFKGLFVLYVTGIPANGIYQGYTYLRDCPGSSPTDYKQIGTSVLDGCLEGYKWPLLVYERVDFGKSKEN